QQARHRGGRSSPRRRLHARPRRRRERNKCNAVREAELQLHRRSRTGCGPRPLPQCHDGEARLFPAKTLPEFIAYAKANPGNLNHGSFGRGTTQYLAAELFKMMAGVSFVHVPYRGAAPALTDLLSGQVQVLFEALPPSIEHIKAGT